MLLCRDLIGNAYNHMSRAAIKRLFLNRSPDLQALQAHYVNPGRLRFSLSILGKQSVEQKQSLGQTKEHLWHSRKGLWGAAELK
jgi:hypothetical protein